MAKILLVEDDNNLREIFEMRLQADGYQTVTAGNGEEGLTVAMKEKPDLIIADVMMPKLSGFDMLENLRAVPEMKDVKVIMMTALGQAEDRSRGESLGVVKYLVKSQATLEDFARTVREVLPPAAQAAPGDNQTKDAQNNQPERVNMQNDQPTNDMPGNDAGMPADNAAPATPPAADTDTPQTTEQEQGVVNDQINNFAAPAPSEPAMPPADAPAGGDGSSMGSDAGMPAEPAAGSTVTPSEPPADAPATPPAAPATDSNPTPPAEAPSAPDNSGSL